MICLFAVYRRGADREQRDNSGYTPLDYADQRNFSDCRKILSSYGQRRPGSTTSLMSRVSVNITPAPSSLDEDGHVIFRQFPRQFSISSTSTSVSWDRPPADGQAHNSSLEQGTVEEDKPGQKRVSSHMAGSNEERGRSMGQVESAEDESSVQLSKKSSEDRRSKGSSSAQGETKQPMEPRQQMELRRQSLAVERALYMAIDRQNEQVCHCVAML